MSFVLTKCREPFPHVNVYNLFPKELHMKIYEYIEKNKNYFEKYTHRENRFGKDIHGIPEVIEYIDKIKQTIIDVNVDELKKRDLPLTAESYVYLDSMLCYDKPGYSIEKHSDTLRKCITCVCYVNNCNGSGTLLYSRNQKRQKEVDGIQNSALIFIPRKGGTIHEVPESTFERYTLQISFQLKI